MVAISVLQPEADLWPAPPVDPPARSRPRSARPPVRSPARPLPDRATRWRRRRLAVLVTATMVVAGASAGTVQAVGALVPARGAATRPEPAAAGAGPVAPAEGEVYIVQPGDTLWTVAAALAPDRDPRPVVDRLRALNGGAALDVGDRLVIDIG